MSSSSGNKTANGNFWPSLMVIAVLCLLLLPSFGVLFGPLREARRMAAFANLRSIINEYQPYSQGGPQGHIFQPKAGDNAHDLAVILSANSTVADPLLWVVKSDPANAGLPFPHNVLAGSAVNKAMDPEFAKLTLSYEFAANIPGKAGSNTTPIAWTRGLRPDGTWAPDSPWQGQGGHIAYLDGHIEWTDRLYLDGSGTTLVKFGTNTPTTNIRDALPPEAVILSAAPSGSQK